jgi:bifunctional non-homologous end joining protein LigD
MTGPTSRNDGIRVLAFVVASDARPITRNLKDKTKQFPEIIADLKKLSGKTGRTLVLDGEIVALVNGELGRFQELQSRMHVENEAAIKRRVKHTPVAFVVFDILADGDDILAAEPWTVRRTRLERRLARRKLKTIRLAESSEDGVEMLRVAQEHGWEGILAKRMSAPYRPGVRSKDWLKLKIEQQQEFVVGGYTEPRNTRSHLGAILLGYYDDGDLIYAGHTGGGFSGKTLTEMYKALHPLERKTSPFQTTPKTNEKPHWTEPRVVVEVRFNEWTRDGKLRQPIFLGIRDDKDPGEVRRES